MDCIEGYNKRLENNTKIQDTMNYSLGNYIKIAFHDPKHYPKEPFSKSKEEETAEICNTDDQRIRMARIKYGKKQ